MTRPRSMFVLLSLLLAGPLGAQSPWSKVPALPATCYSGGDPFQDNVEAALASVETSRQRQDSVNQRVKEAYDDLDPATKQSRIMAYMTKDPAAAMAFMQSLNAPSTPEAAAAYAGREDAFQEQFQALDTKYSAESRRVLNPILVELDNATGAQVAAAMAKYNRAYEVLCANWITKGSFTDFLARFRAYMVDEYLPFIEKADLTRKEMMGHFGVDATGYQSTAAMDAARKYMNYASSIFGHRRIKPLDPHRPDER